MTGAAIHPDTGDVIPWYQRMSSFTFLQVPIAVGLTMAPPTTFNTFFWHWLNQTYYAGLNYGNRNATSINSTVSIFLSYTAAAFSSVFIAIFLRKFLGGSAALRMRIGNQIFFNTTTSFIALAGASVVNAIVMRSSELQHGITIYDETDKAAGLSKRAAWQAVMQTAYTRIFLAFQTVFVPGVTIAMLNNLGYMPKNKLFRSVAEVSVLAALLTVGLPISIAFFSQRGHIKAKFTEKEF